MGVVGVALALSISYGILALLGIVAMRRERKRIDGRRLLRSLAKMLLAGGAMYAVAWGVTAVLEEGSGLLQRTAIIAVAGGASLAVYLGVSLLLNVEELKPAISLLRRRGARMENL
jgi:putative peptidoglycan lipid II flippase